MIIPDFQSIIKKLKTDDISCVLDCLDELSTLKSKDYNINEAYPFINKYLFDENEEIRWKTAELFDIIPQHLKLKTATSQEKIKELEFLSDCTIPNMVQDRSERDIEYSMPLLAVLLFDNDTKVRESDIETIGSTQSDNQDFTITI